MSCGDWWRRLGTRGDVVDAERGLLSASTIRDDESISADDGGGSEEERKTGSDEDHVVLVVKVVPDRIM